MNLLSRLVLLAATLFATVVSGGALAAPFTPGNLVVYRIGTGAALVSGAATAVFLDEYTTAGALVQSIALPTADAGANQMLTASSTATTEGFMSRSADGSYLVLPGYDAAPGEPNIAASSSATFNRVVGRVDSAGAIDTSTALNTFNLGNIRGVASSNGTNIWLTGSNTGVVHAVLGSTSATTIHSTVTNLRGALVADGQLYISSGAGSIRVGSVGTGTPTTAGQTITSLPGLPTGGISVNQFAFADLDGAVAGVDTLYVCDDTGGTGALRKYSLVTGSWTATGSVAGLCRGLAISVSGSTVTAFVTNTATTANSIQTVTDNTGYNGTLSGTFTTIATAGANTVFRGLALAPVAPVVSNPDLTISVSGPTTGFTGVNYNYTLTVANGGSTSATGVGANFTLPGGVSFVSASGNSGFTGSNVGGVVQFTGGTVAGSASATLTVTVAPSSPTISVSPGAAIVDPGATVTESDETNNTSTQTISTTVGPILFISAVQGTGLASPYLNQPVGVEGIVTAVYPGLGGFFVQEEPADYDADPNTSEALFVASNAAVSVGDQVRVGGTAVETFNLTQITSATVSIQSSGNPLPPAVSLALPMASTTDWEKYESMRVSLTQTLTVTETFDLAAFGEVLLSSNGRLFNPTGTIDPNDNPASGTTSTGTSNVAAVNAATAANVLNSIRLDDGAGTTNPATIPYWNSTDNTLRLGATLTGPTTGVLHFAFSTYRVLPESVLTFADAPRPATPPSVGAANLKVAAFNVLNYFNGNGSGLDGVPGGFPTPRGANTLNEFTRQRAKIIAAITQLGADIVGLIEIENDGSGSTSAIQDLVTGLNVAIPGTWAFIADPAGYGPAGLGSIPGGTDAIKTAIIYKPAVVSPVGLATASADNAFSNARAPVAQTFSLLANGEKLTLVVNHFKSKGSGTGLDADQLDGQGASNHSRRLQADALVTFVNSLVISSGDPDVLLLGDFNAYDQEDPIDILRAATLSPLGTSLYSYNFDGQSGSLDHAIATSSLVAQVTGAEKWHINADEPVVLDYNVEGKNTAGCVISSCTSPDYYQPTPYRSSDHDPILVGLNLTLAATAPTAPQNLQGTAGNMQMVLTYQAPSSDGGSPVTGYTANCTGGSGATGNSVGAALTITLNGLTNGVTYSCTVTATNAIGTGPASTAATNLTPSTVPDPPTGINVTAGNAQASITYTAPASNGGSPITGYSVSCNNGVSGNSAGAVLLIALSSLVNGTTYACTFTANNANGASAPSAVVNFTPSTVPDAPTNLQGNAGDASGTITYLAPASNGGSPITGYTASCTGGVTGNSVGAGLTITLSPLTNGTTYTCTVVANNANGPSVPSASVQVSPQQPSFALTVSKSGAGSGGVTSNPAGIDCGATCVGTFANGATVTLTATPAAGSTFAGWSGACSGTAACVVTMGGDRAVTATFNSADQTLTVNKAGSGTGTVSSTAPASPSIDCGATCSASYAAGTVVTLSATATPGSSFTGWSGACSGTGGCSVTMDAAKSVTATFVNPPRLVNISTRMQVQTGDNVLIGGFIIGGSIPKTVVVRARGPSLAPLGVNNVLLNPKLDLYSGQTVIASNDDHGSAANAAAIQASGFAPPDALESAILITLQPGPYTAIVSGVGGTTGVGLMEIFELDHFEIPLVNVATRGRVLTGEDVMIAGFIIQGNAPQTVVVRARGPSLVPFGIVNPLVNPTLELFSGQTMIGTNDDWQSAANQAELFASGFAPADNVESAMLVTLQPGAYSVIVRGKAGGTGVAIVEVFAR